MATATFYGNAGFGGWIAYKNGKAVKYRSGKVRVFACEADAIRAARQSRAK